MGSSLCLILGQKRMKVVLCDKLGENVDLNNWTLPEIIKVVAEFKILFKEEKTRQNNREEKFKESKRVEQVTPRQPNPIKKEYLIQSIKKNNKVFYDWKNWWFLELNQSIELWDYEIHQHEKCKQSKPLFKFIQEPKIDFINCSVKKTDGLIFGMGARNQLVMRFKTNFTQNIVARTSDDITWLRNHLIAQFPGSFIPPYLAVSSINQQDKEGTMKYSYSAQFFLNSLLEYQYLIHNAFFFQFMSQSDLKKFEAFKLQKGEFKVVNKLNQIERLEGQTEIEISQRVLNFVKQTTSYSVEVEKCYRSALTNINKILGDMENLAKDFKEAANDFTKIFHKHKKMVEICKIEGIKYKQQQKISDTYMCLHNIFTKMEEQQKQSILILKKLSEDFISGIHSQWQEFKTHQDDYLGKHNSYLLNKNNLLKNKDRSGEKQGQIFKMEEQSRLWQAYLNKMYEKSFRILMNHQQRVCVKNFREFCQKMDQLHEKQSRVFQKFHEMIVP